MLNSLILAARSMDDPPQLEPPRVAANFSLTVMAYFETYPHEKKGMSVFKLYQEEPDEYDLLYFSPPPCNPTIPDELTELSEELTAETQQHFVDYLSETLPTDHFLIQVAEQSLSDSLISVINKSPAQFMLLVTTEKATNLRRFTQIAQRLDPRIKIALSDRTVNGIDASDIKRLLRLSICSNFYYLALHHLDDGTACNIATCANLKNLVGLSVERSYMTGKGVLAFGESLNLPNLKVFSVDLMTLLRVTQCDFTVRMAPFQYRLYRYEWVGRII